MGKECSLLNVSDVLKFILLGLRLGTVNLKVHLLRIYRTEEAPNRCIVIAFTGAAHTDFGVVSLQDWPDLDTGIMAAAIGIMCQPWIEMLLNNGIRQRILDNVCIDLVGNTPTRDCELVEIDVHGSIQPAFMGRDKNVVCPPFYIGAFASCVGCGLCLPVFVHN